jgi:pantoate--beta-alanine ligase
MILFKEATALAAFLSKQKEHNRTIGYVPTMGALHAGHISLVELSKSKTDVTVCSIFINPTQFNDLKDFEKYPVTISADILALETARCDVLFLPSVREIYPDGASQKIDYNIGKLETIMEGEYRPGHFQGVCQVVHRLLTIISPHYLILGKKDYQQCLIIERLIAELHLPVKVLTATTKREPSGVAMSSRNLRLTEPEKATAAGIFKLLNYIKEHYVYEDIKALEEYGTNYLLNTGFTKVDYLWIVNAENLEPLTAVEKDTGVVALVAAYINDVRLIDNLMLTE